MGMSRCLELAAMPLRLALLQQTIFSPLNFLDPGARRVHELFALFQLGLRRLFSRILSCGHQIPGCLDSGVRLLPKCVQSPLLIRIIDGQKAQPRQILPRRVSSRLVRLQE